VLDAPRPQEPRQPAVVSAFSRVARTAIRPR
jgi:hypothetical protein